MKKILIIAPHMDDEVLGCGGTILRYTEEKKDVFICFIANRAYRHRIDKNKNRIQKKHTLLAKRILGYKEAVFYELNDERLDISVQDIIILLECYVNKIQPGAVYIPFMGDNNQDHRAVFDAARVALRPAATPFVNSVYMYEIPSSTEQSPPLKESAFLPNYYVDITKYIDKKTKAFSSYKDERRKYPHPRSERAIRALAQKRGVEIGFKYAEAFMVLREKAR
ncbi:MAG: PIG-L family deacetylase [Candidatus Omnitrophota bacterium]|nr:MAG: PIG-L family deacetylase [Candidatus Omnitrophota bacterium]